MEKKKQKKNILCTPSDVRLRFKIQVRMRGHTLITHMYNNWSRSNINSSSQKVTQVI